MSISTDLNESSFKNSFDFNRSQIEIIKQGLQSNHRLAFKNGSFIKLDKRNSDSHLIQNLNELNKKIEEFIIEADGIGIFSNDFNEIQQLALKRSHALDGKLTGIRGLFKKNATKLKLQEQSTCLKNIAEKVNSLNKTFLDDNCLIEGSPDASSISSSYKEWYLSQATLLEQMEKVDDPKIKNQLALAMLHSYWKVASLTQGTIDHYKIQVSPIQERGRYHRTPGNLLLRKVNHAFAQDVKMGANEVMLVQSSFFREILAREMDLVKIESEEQFFAHIDTVLKDAASGQFPDKLIFVDLTEYIKNQKLEPKDLNQHLLSWKNKLDEKIIQFQNSHPSIRNIENKISSKIQPISFTEHKEEQLLLLPTFICKNESIVNLIDNMLSRSGFYLSPDDAKSAWLKVADPASILAHYGIPKTKLATRGKSIPQVFKNYGDFLSHPVISKFRNLSSENIPYLQILPEATVQLLEGLQPHNIDEFYANQGITDLLQLSYYRIMNAMGEAILRKGDLMAFNNQIELIHQEIQTILTIVQPYKNEEYSKVMEEKFTAGESSFLSSDLPPPLFHLKSSGMHCVANSLAGVEAQKGTNRLNVAVLKNGYYENEELLRYSKTYNLSTFDGDLYKNEKDVKNAFKEPPNEPLDVLFCEFHHNFSPTVKKYQPEYIADYITGLFKHRMVSDKFTVVIDTTINLEKSEEISSLLNDKFIKNLINDGKLNIVLLRSAHKFDLFGIDNYCGGISVTINNGSFDKFNERIQAASEQVRGLSYQGITHLQKYGSHYLDLYRKKIMENTLKMYNLLPKRSLYDTKSNNPLQISQIHDDKLVFLDIKFPNFPKTANVFTRGFLKYVKAKNLPVSARSSFGFSTTNLNYIEIDKDNIMIRLNIGLEDGRSLDAYAEFFRNVQDILNGMKENATDKEIAEELENYFFL